MRNSSFPKARLPIGSRAFGLPDTTHPGINQRIFGRLFRPRAASL